MASGIEQPTNLENVQCSEVSSSDSSIVSLVEETNEKKENMTFAAELEKSEVAAEMQKIYEEK